MDVAHTRIDFAQMKPAVSQDGSVGKAHVTTSKHETHSVKILRYQPKLVKLENNYKQYGPGWFVSGCSRF